MRSINRDFDGGSGRLGVREEGGKKKRYFAQYGGREREFAHYSSSTYTSKRGVRGKPTPGGEREARLTRFWVSTTG